MVPYWQLDVSYLKLSRSSNSKVTPNHYTISAVFYYQYVALSLIRWISNDIQSQIKLTFVSPEDRNVFRRVLCIPIFYTLKSPQILFYQVSLVLSGFFDSLLDKTLLRSWSIFGRPPLKPRTRFIDGPELAFFGPRQGLMVQFHLPQMKQETNQVLIKTD